MWPFDSVLFTQGVLPFLLVFVLIFAILQKSKILGDGKAQIDALIALAIALILIGFPTPRDLIVSIMPWVAVGASVILVFFILYGFVGGDIGTNMPKGLQVTFGILAGIFTLGVVLYLTGAWSKIVDWIGGSGDSSIWASVVMVVIIGGALALAIVTGKKSGSSGKKGSE